MGEASLAAKVEASPGGPCWLGGRVGNCEGPLRALVRLHWAETGTPRRLCPLVKRCYGT